MQSGYCLGRRHLFSKEVLRSFFYGRRQRREPIGCESHLETTRRKERKNLGLFCTAPKTQERTKYKENEMKRNEILNPPVPRLCFVVYVSSLPPSLSLSLSLSLCSVCFFKYKRSTLPIVTLAALRPVSNDRRTSR